MPYVWLYPVIPADSFIEKLVTCLSDAGYQAAALAQVSPDLPLDPYVLVSESAVWRENMETPALLVKDVTTDSRETGGPLLDRTHRFSVYQMLAAATTPEGEASLMREAYRRAAGVEMMIRNAQANGFDLFAGMEASPGSPIVRLNYGDTVPGKASYYRFPSVDVEIPTLEA